MSRMNEMKNLRGGVAYRAADVSPTTAHSWPIEVGTSRGEGHKRYDLTDVVALSLMRTLTVGRAVTATHAGRIVAQLQPSLRALVERAVLELERDKVFRWEGFPIAVVSGAADYPGQENTVRIFDDAASFGAFLADRSSGFAPLVLPLQRLILRAVYSLDNVMFGDKRPYDEDGTLPVDIAVK